MNDRVGSHNLSALLKMSRALLTLSALLLVYYTLISSAEKTDKIIVKLKPFVSVEEITSTHPGVKFERESTIPRVFIFSAQNIDAADEETEKFSLDNKVAWAHVDEIYDDEPMAMPTDPSLLSGDQWFHDYINSSYAWSKGLSGQGQLVQVIDTPVFPNEADLIGQLDFERSFGGDIPAPPFGSGTHGTICTNLILAKSNDFCGVGVSFSARAAFFPFIQHPGRRFSDIIFNEAFAQGFSVSSNSWGRTLCNMRGCNINMASQTLFDALELAQERNNTVFVFASGNAGIHQGSPNFDRFGSTPRTIMVGSTRRNGQIASYSNVGPANWIVAPAGDHGENVTWTSSIAMTGVQNCGPVGVGTSWSAPMVSGAAAILRSAYPSLTWRDVKLILAYSADRTDIDNESWIKNGAGRWFSNQFGFGQLNVGNAVELASTWKSVGPLQIRTFHSNFPAFRFNADNLQTTASVTVIPGIISKVESVQLTLNLFGQRGPFQIDLISPSGTVCNIFRFRRDNGRNYNNFMTSANCFLDEDPAGEWTLNVTRQGLVFGIETLNSFAVTVWGETAPSQVQLLAPSTASRLSSFTIKEGDTFQQLVLFHNFPATIGLFWKDTFGLYGEVFTPQGKQTSGTQRLNPSNSDHPTVSVFYGGDHVLTYLTTEDGAITMQAEVRNIDFIPLTPLTALPLNVTVPESVTVTAIENSMVVSYRSSEESYTKLALLNVNFGSRDTTPLCVPFTNFTTEVDENGDLTDDENDCTEIVYRRDGEITLMKQIEIMTQAPVTLQGIGMNLILGTWSDGQSITAALIRSDLTMNITKLQAPPTSIVRAAATPEDVFIAFGHQQGVLLERYDTDLVLHESFVVPTNEPVVAISLTYTHVEGLSLIVATSHNISLTTFLRSYDRSFVQTNQATIASMLSLNVPVLDIDQSVMSNGDLAVTFSTIQEIHVQLFDSSVFGTAPLPPMTPVDSTVPQYEEVVPSTTTEQPITDTPQTDIVGNGLENQLPSWAIALIVIGSLLAIFFAVIFIVAYQKKKMQARGRAVQGDPDMIAYTKMNV